MVGAGQGADRIQPMTPGQGRVSQVSGQANALPLARRQSLRAVQNAVRNPGLADFLDQPRRADRGGGFRVETQVRRRPAGNVRNRW